MLAILVVWQICEQMHLCDNASINMQAMVGSAQGRESGRNDDQGEREAGVTTEPAVTTAPFHLARHASVASTYTHSSERLLDGSY